MRPDDFEKEMDQQKGWKKGLAGLFQAPLVGYGKFPAALLPAAGNHFTAVLGSHAAAKTMFILARAPGRLIGTFHRLF